MTALMAGMLHGRRKFTLLAALFMLTLYSAIFSSRSSIFAISKTKSSNEKTSDEVQETVESHKIAFTLGRGSLKVTTKVISETAKIASATTTTTTTSTTASIIPWINEADPMEFVEHKILRCKAQFLGCFVTVDSMTPPSNGSFIKHKMAEKGDLRDSCLDKCISNGSHLAGFSNRMKICVCSTTYEGFISSKKHGKYASTSMDIANHCRNGKSYRVYNINRKCVHGVQKSEIKEDLVGCIDVPQQLRGMMIALRHPDLTSEQCILNCELRMFHFAIPVLKSGVCICSDSYSLFHTAENMSKMMKICQHERDGTRVLVYRTFIDDEHCRPRFLHIGQAPPILLASYYGSGNTWIRHLIELSTGIYTGSVFKDFNLYEGGMLGEPNPYDSGRTIAVKDHLFKLNLKPGYQMAILLLRNPYDATMAEWSRRNTKNHTGVTDVRTYKSPAFKKFAEHRPEYWAGIVKTVLKSFDKVLVIYYEDLKKDAIKQMRRLAKFLPDNLVPSQGEAFERRLMCMNLDLVGKFKRAPRKLGFDPFNPLQRDFYDKTIRDVDDLLLQYRQPPLRDSYFLPS